MKLWAVSFVLLLAAAASAGVTALVRTTGVAWLAVVLGVLAIVTALLSVRRSA